MVVVKIKNGEPFEKSLRRFRRKVETEGIMRELRKRKFYLSKSEKRKEKSRLAQKRRKKSLIRNKK